MIKHLLPVVLACLLSASAWSQSDQGTLSVIPKAGISISTLNPTDRIYLDISNDEASSGGSKYRSGFCAGAELEYQFADRLSASVGAFFANSGCKYGYAEAEMSKNEFSVLHDSYLSLGYIQMPLMLNCYVAPNLAVKAGIQVGYLVTSTRHGEMQTYTVDPDTNAKTYGTNYVSDGSASGVLNRVDIAIPLGLSYEYEHMVLDARYNLGVRKIYKLAGDSKNRSVTVTIGYKFEL
ncbi:MAG: PorT family protein [Prevotella sp.]|nr:PorT family protein [Prevotella sp.]